MTDHALRQAAEFYRASRDRSPSTAEGRRPAPAIIPARASRFYCAASLAQRPVPPRAWLVRDLVPTGTVTLLGGDGGTGKSLLALQLTHAVATGGAWLGRSVATGGALYVSAEDDEAELHRRLADVVQASGGSFDDLNRLTLRSLAGEDGLLAMLDRSGGGLQASALFHEIETRIAEEKPALVVLDTLADLFPGNENDRAQARQFIGLLRGLAIRHACAMVLLAHPSLSGLSSGSGTSGSTGWNNSVRSRLYLARVQDDGFEADPDLRTLRSMKANYSRTGAEITLRWQSGVFVAQENETGLDRMASGAKAERVFVKLLRLLADQGRRVNTGGGQTYAPTVFANHPEAEGVSKRAFRSAMETLLRNRAIVIAEDGPPSKRRQYLEVSQ
jgi:RecA-family ATPase